MYSRLGVEKFACDCSTRVGGEHEAVFFTTMCRPFCAGSAFLRGIRDHEFGVGVLIGGVGARSRSVEATRCFSRCASSESEAAAIFP